MFQPSVTMNRAILAAEIQRFTRGRLPREIDKIVRRSALLGVSEIVKSLNGEEAGYPNPKRIDTGRYRAGWGIGLQQAIGTRIGVPSSTDPKNQTEAGDGTGTQTGRGTLTNRVRVENNVRYGIYVEEGTVFMRPGNHLERALLVAAADIRKAAGKAIPDAWIDRISSSSVGAST